MLRGSATSGLSQTHSFIFSAVSSAPTSRLPSKVDVTLITIESD